MFQLIATKTLTKSTLTLKSASRAQALSTQCATSIEKLQNVFEEYRQTHYKQCMPSRFAKEVVKAACKAQGNENENKIGIEGLERVLNNIGASNRLSRSDISLIVSEYGEEQGAIRSDQMSRLLSNRLSRTNE